LDDYLVEDLNYEKVFTVVIDYQKVQKYIAVSDCVVWRAKFKTPQQKELQVINWSRKNPFSKLIRDCSSESDGLYFMTTIEQSLSDY